jgi:phage FluMu gp28-like protein
MDLRTAQLQRMAEFAEEALTIAGEPLRLEKPWQFNLVNCADQRQVYNKGRQIGFSWAIALRGVLRAVFLPKHSYTNIFVSINRDEAREKIRYCEIFIHALQDKGLLKKFDPPKTTIEFPNGNRIESYPSRAVRGKANVDLVLDEFAHVKDDYDIYRGSLPATLRGFYGVTVGSTPYGRGCFKDIFTQAGTEEGTYKLFKKHEIPWWLSEFLCKDVLRASMEAPTMTTKERVYKYGKDVLVQEFESQMLEVFQMEFECSFFDSIGSVLTEKLITDQSDGDLDCNLLDIDCEDKAMDTRELVKVTIDDIKARRHQELFLGYDVGRELNATEFTVLSFRKDKDGNEKLFTEAYITVRRGPFPVQEAIANQLLNELPIKKAAIDNQGLGMQLGESLDRRHGPRIKRMTFSFLTKEEMVSGLVKAFESDRIKIYPTRFLLSQLLSVKKVSSESGKILYKSESAKEDKYTSHSDKFWSLALAVWAADDYHKGHIEITKRSPFIFGARNRGMI